MPEHKLIVPTNDLVFQRIFGKEKNKEITAHLISLIIGREIKDINLDVNKQFLGNNIDSKEIRLDIRAKFNNGEDCNIEMQVKAYPYMPERIVGYWARMHGSKLERGKKYDLLKPSISILIADYFVDKTHSVKDYHTKWNLREEKHPELVLTDNIEIHILELPKILKSEFDKNDELIQWLKFIKSPDDEEVLKFMEENKYLKQAREEFKHLEGEEGFERLVQARADFLWDQDFDKMVSFDKGVESGIELGTAKGEKTEKIKTAKKLLAKGINIKEVSEITELSEEEILEISKNK